MKLQYRNSAPLVDNIKTFVFTPTEPETWQAGQFIHLTLAHENQDDRGDERWFTISSAPFEKDVWITTRWFGENSSTFKKTLNKLEPGDIIEVDEPEGNFIESDVNVEYIFVAGGIGITPIRSILKQLDFEGKPIRAELLYANRDSENIAFKEELELLSDKHEGFNITYYIGDHLIDESDLRNFGSKTQNPHYYISGPEPMVKAFKATLNSIGIEKSHIKLDYFPGYDEI